MQIALVILKILVEKVKHQWPHFLAHPVYAAFLPCKLQDEVWQEDYSVDESCM